MFSGEAKSVQIAILAGGLATRMFPLTEDIPKSMLKVYGRPFLEHQLDLLRASGVKDIVLCIGHLGDKIKGYFGDGERFGVGIRYSEEENGLLGTAGALKKAEGLLEDEFLVMYGDSYLLLDYGGIMDYFRQTSRLGLMVVYKNYDRYDASNVVVTDGLVKIYDKRTKTAEMIYIDAGLSALSKQALALVPQNEVCSLEYLFGRLVQSQQLLAYETRQRFYEVGSPAGLEDFQRLVGAKGIGKLSSPSILERSTRSVSEDEDCLHRG